MPISDWSSDVCSSDLLAAATAQQREAGQQLERIRTLKERGFATNASLDAQVAAFGSARAAAAQAKAAIADRVIRAPFSGWVSLRNVSAGAVIPACKRVGEGKRVSVTLAPGGSP